MGRPTRFAQTVLDLQFGCIQAHSLPYNKPIHMAKEKSKTNLIYNSIEAHKQSGRPLELKSEKKLDFENLDFEAIRPKNSQIDYSSVKIRTSLYMQIKEAAEERGIRQPGKFISLILEEYLKQTNREA